MSISNLDLAEDSLLSLEEGNCLEAAPFGDPSLLTGTDSDAAPLGLTAETVLPPLPYGVHTSGVWARLHPTKIPSNRLSPRTSVDMPGGR